MSNSSFVEKRLLAEYKLCLLNRYIDEQSEIIKRQALRYIAKKSIDIAQELESHDIEVVLRNLFSIYVETNYENWSVRKISKRFTMYRIEMWHASILFILIVCLASLFASHPIIFTIIVGGRILVETIFAILISKNLVWYSSIIKFNRLIGRYNRRSKNLKRKITFWAKQQHRLHRLIEENTFNEEYEWTKKFSRE